VDDIPLETRFQAAEKNDLRCPDEKAAARMRARIEEIMAAGDTIGGIVEVLALGLPPGLGTHVHWDRRLDTRLAGALISVQSVKGVEIGPAFANTRLPGTRVHDAIHLEEGQLTRDSNRAGGIEGGISNGQPLVLRAALKPIATTLTPQRTVDLAKGAEAPTRYERSDYCPVPRAVPILEAMTAFVLADALIEKLGGDSLEEMLPRFRSLKQARLEDLPVDDRPHRWWE
jgi:chorismate synthase